MKKLLFVIFFKIAFNSNAQSNWVFVSSNTVQYDYFVYKSSFQTQGDSFTFWVRTNYQKRDKFGDLSSKIQYTINCRTREFIMRYSMYYDDKDNNGQLTTSGNPSNPSWNPVSPDSVVWSVYKFVCK